MGYVGALLEVGQEAAEEFVLEPCGKPLGAALSIASLEAHEESARGLADAFSGRADNSFSATGDSAGDGCLGRQFGCRMACGLNGRLADQVAGHDETADGKSEGQCRSGQCGHVVE